MVIVGRTTLYLNGPFGSDCKTEIVQPFTDQIQKPKTSKKVNSQNTIRYPVKKIIMVFYDLE